MTAEFDARGKQVRRGRLVLRREPNGRSQRKNQSIGVVTQAQNRKILACADPANLCAIYIICPIKTLKPTKIGVSNDPQDRVSSLQTSHWLRLKVAKEIWVASSPLAFLVERQSHIHMEDRFTRLLGEWFDASIDDAECVLRSVMNDLNIEPIDRYGESVLNVISREC